MPDRRSIIIWLVRGLGGIVQMVVDWTKDFGPVPEDQYLLLQDYADKLRLLPRPKQ